MSGLRSITALLRLFRAGWLGPHFYCDLIRLARKGWPTLARVGFLALVLVSLLIMDRTQGGSVHFTEPAEFARRAHRFAYLLLVLQYLLVLALLPVYVASAIVEEKENQTLESLTLTHLTDRELVLGKLGARLMHVGAFALANFPLLAFMHLWGNVDGSLLLYHEINLFLMLLSAGSVCIWISSTSESVFQAISRSYGWLALVGFASMLGAFALPGTVARLLGIVQTATAWLFPQVGRPADGPDYWSALLILAAVHGSLTLLALYQSVRRMEFLRREERRAPKKTTGALALTDNRPISLAVGKRGQAKSRIHPWAWPVWGNALLWKECVKDGSTYSLSSRWLLIGLAIVVPLAITLRLLKMAAPDNDRFGPQALAYSFTYTTYFISLAAYGLVVLFQMTMSVAGEREQGTLTFLLMIPDDRRTVLFAKWLGPWWRNWPILAVCYLGVALGWGSGLYGWHGVLLLVFLPWPLMLMLGCLALWLSVVCRRVLFANVVVVGILGLLVIAHIAVGEPAWTALAYSIAVIGDLSLLSLRVNASGFDAGMHALGQQAIFLAAAGTFLGHAFWVFRKKDYSSG